jgi:hypothetical protein
LRSLTPNKPKFVLPYVCSVEMNWNYRIIV